MQKTCIIVPCYNEEKRFNVLEFINFLNNVEGIDFYFVDDGSIDNTTEVLNQVFEACPNRVKIFNQTINSGKAEAVRYGCNKALAHGGYDFIGFWDADLAAPLIEINEMISLLKKNERYLFILGSRVMRLGSNIQRNPYRHLFARVFITFVNLILKLPVYDTQCGAKIFRKKVAEIAFVDPFKSSWIFDVEILARLRNEIGIEECLKTIVEYPVRQWTDVSGSKLRLKHFLKVPYHLFKINKIFYNNSLIKSIY